jgi:hypothetical protein
MQLLLLVSELLDLPTVLAGHGYDTGSAPRRESRVDDGGGGIGTAPIVVVLFLTLVTVALLVRLDPSAAIAKSKAVAPRAVIVGVVAAPLMLWTAFPGGDAGSLMVERATGPSGAPELLISLADEDLNTLEATDGERAVRVECLGRDGEMVLDSQHRWPFVTERDYDVPHAHQPATAEELRQADHCRLRGTRDHLEADVEGRLR